MSSPRTFDETHTRTILMLDFWFRAAMTEKAG
jgi:hypothetical protein